MRRYWLEQESFSELDQSNEILISGDSFKHIVGVCRMAEGARFEVLGLGEKALLVELVDVAKKQARARRIEEREIPPLKKPYVNLVSSLPKFDVLENTLEKSVELGVKEFFVVDSDYAFVKSKNRDLDKKISRWQKIIKSATQQSGRSHLMPLHTGLDLKTFVEEKTKFNNTLHIFAYEGDSSSSLKEGLGAENQSIDEVFIYVGPEGGFSKNEVEFFAQKGIQALTLGDQVLRVETAAISLIAAVKFHFGLFS